MPPAVIVLDRVGFTVAYRDQRTFWKCSYVGNRARVTLAVGLHALESIANMNCAVSCHDFILVGGSHRHTPSLASSLGSSSRESLRFFVFFRSRLVLLFYRFVAREIYNPQYFVVAIVLGHNMLIGQLVKITFRRNRFGLAQGLLWAFPSFGGFGVSTPIGGLLHSILQK